MDVKKKMRAVDAFHAVRERTGDNDSWAVMANRLQAAEQKQPVEVMELIYDLILYMES